MDPPQRRAAWALAGGAAAFLLVWLDVAAGGPLSVLDGRIDAWARSAFSDGVREDTLRGALSLPGDPRAAIVVAGAAAVALALLGAWARAAIALGAELARAALVPLLKDAIARPRPPESGIGSFAFPSGHAAAALLAFALASLLLVRAWDDRHPLRRAPRRLRAALGAGVAAVAAAVGAGRVLGGAHWASDVLAGWALACALVGAALVADGAAARRRPQPGPPASGP